MSNEITKNLMCVVVRGGIEIWIDEEKTDSLQTLIEKGTVVKIGKNVVNTKDVVGIFEAVVMQEVTRRRNGQWKDDKGNWHDKGERLCPKCKQVLPYGMTCGNCRS